MSGKSVEPVRKHVVVEAPQERAFRVFTENIDRWWPREHHIGKTTMKTAVLEPKENGRWYEVCEDGSQCDWGKVLAWEPPRRVVLAWQLSAQWQYDASLITEVEVTFTPEGPRRTRVDLEHRNLERFGDAAEAVRNSVGGTGGWMQLLELYAKAAQG
ncbi:SRPBCC family protein [Pyxidicoccus caerfyrddinensis]|uniref:SRPBCC family protein n=1 Tax=Pyxidicoccus caerfyrddinensis TaxID=2709663 RepID=UPI0013DAB3EC|nr:SRPBCC family protein [Pyxidicoccus caerfyrddinensis]